MTSFHWRDLLDLVVLSFLVYQLLRVVHGTRAVQWLAGIAVLIVAYWLSGLDERFRLPAVHRVLGYILLYVPLVVIVIFQDTIRRGLARFGWNPLRYLLGRPGPREDVLGEIAHTAASMAEKRMGALIVLEGEADLTDQVEGGVELDAQVRQELLESIFLPPGALHDGAVLVRGDRIRLARGFLPVSATGLPGQLGSRHRAAVGVTETTDALAVVVSEESGLISLARMGTLERGLDEARLLERLRGKVPARNGGQVPAPGLGRRLLRNVPAKALSVIIALAIWGQLAFEGETVKDLTSPLVLELPTATALASPVPETVTVRVRGPDTLLDGLSAEGPAARVDLSGLSVGDTRVPLNGLDLRLPPGVEVVWVRPSDVEVSLERRTARELPVQVDVRGSPAPGFAGWSRSSLPAGSWWRVPGPPSRETRRRGSRPLPSTCPEGRGAAWRSSGVLSSKHPKRPTCSSESPCPPSR